MRILFLGNNSFRQHKRGVENVIGFQSKALEFDRVYYVHFGTQTFAYKSDHFACVSVKRSWYWPVTLNVVLHKIQRKGKYIIHSHNPLLSVCSIQKTSILTVHDGLYYYNKSIGNRLSFLLKWIEVLLYFRCSVVHFISNYTKEQSLFGNRKNFVIIPNTSHFEPAVPMGELPKRPIDKTIVLIVRSVEERARFDLLLQVSERLNEHEYQFMVAGKGPLLDHYKNEIGIRGIRNIDMLGYVNDQELFNLYSNCTMVLMIAEYGEGFGLPIIEGYLFNKPVLASNRCAIPEVIISADFLFENSVENIVQKIVGLPAMDKKSYRKYYDLKYSNAIILLQFRNLYFQTSAVRLLI